MAAVEAHNVQGEFNFHNLAFLQGGGLSSAQDFNGMLRAMLDVQFLFQLGFYCYFLFLPLLLVVPFVKKIANWAGYLVPSHRFIVTTIGLIVLSYIFVFQTPGEDMKDRVIEIRETVFAGAILFYLALAMLPWFERRIHWYLD